MMNYSVRKTTNGEIMLFVNGNSSRCPFTPPMVVPNPLTQRMDISIMPCSTACPLADFKENEWNGVYKTNCSGKEIEHFIELDSDKKEDDKEDQSGSIIRSLN